MGTRRSILARSLAVAVAATLVVSGHTLRAQETAADFAPGNTDVGSIDRELASNTAEIERLAHEAEQIASESQGLEPRHAALVQRARAEARLLYHLVQGQAFAIQRGPEALLDHVARADHVRRTLQTTLRDLDRVTERTRTIVADRARIDALLADARTRHETLERQHTQAEALGGMRLTVSQAGLSGDPIAAGAGGALAAGETAIPADSVTLYGGGVAQTSPDSASFADSAGHLLFPVAGRAEVRRARREGAEGPGVEIMVARGTPVRAVYPGRVAFADRYGAYGRIVILEHGDHYYSVSANLASMSVHVGEEVSAGTVLGAVGDDGRGPMLYFEVRRGSETVDPGPFLGL
jgi:murein DD-endopeptidase MepM/ murein hydrolase activator NlpD